MCIRKGTIHEIVLIKNDSTKYRGCVYYCRKTFFPDRVKTFLLSYRFTTHKVTGEKTYRPFDK